MTVPIQNTIVSYTGNGVATVFTIPFKILLAADLIVLLFGTPTQDYTLSGLGDDEATLTFNSPPVNGAPILAYREVALDRLTDYQFNGDLRAVAVNSDFDRLWMAMQDTAGTANRSLHFPITEFSLNSEIPAAATRATKALIFDSAGNATVSVSPYQEGDSIVQQAIDAANAIVGSITTPTFQAYVPTVLRDGVDYVSGTSNSVALPPTVSGKTISGVFMDASYQSPTQYTLNAAGTLLTFSSVIPLGIAEIDVMYFSPSLLGLYRALGIGAVSRTFQDKMREQLSVKDFGVRGDGTTFDTAAINIAEAAARAAGKDLYFPPGIYVLPVNTPITKLSGVQWYGAGKKLSVIRAAPGAWTVPLVTGGDVSDASIRGMGFDFSPSTFHSFLRNIFFTTFTRGEIEECDFVQHAIGFQCDGGSYFSIHHNSFEQVTAYGNFINEAVWITRNTSIPSNYSFCDNTCINVGTDFDGDIVLIARNNIQNWAYGAGITTEVNSFAFTIEGNFCAGGGPNPDGNNVPPDGIESWSNQSVIIGNTVLSCAGVGINIGGSNSVCDGNVCLNNGTWSGGGTPIIYRAGIILRYIDANTNGNTSVITNNLCVDTGGGTQLWGITDDGVNCGGCTIANNMFIGAFAPMNLGGTRNDFKGPKLQMTATGSAGFTLAAGTSGGGNSGLAFSGAQLGDKATISINQNTQGLIGTAWVVSPGNVAWSFFNPTGASITVPNYTVNLAVEKPLNYANY